MPVGILILALATAGCALARNCSILCFVRNPDALGHGFLRVADLCSGYDELVLQKRGLVLGLAQMGGGLSMTYAIFVEFVIEEVGWRSTFLILAELYLHLSPFGNFFLLLPSSG